jgi:hypothetical protein
VLFDPRNAQFFSMLFLPAGTCKSTCREEKGNANRIQMPTRG